MNPNWLPWRSRPARWSRLVLVGVLLCAIILAVWIASVPLCFQYTRNYGGAGVPEGFYAIMCLSGRVDFIHGYYRWPYGSYWGCFLLRPSHPLRHLQWRVEVLSSAAKSALTVPLWIPFAVVAVPTALLWRAGRRSSPPGFCPDCGYNLTGNVSGVCPEFGGGAIKGRLKRGRS